MPASIKRYVPNRPADRTQINQVVHVALAPGQTVQFTLVPGQPLLAPGEPVQVVLAPGQGVLVPGQVVQVILAPSQVVLAPAQVVLVPGQVFPVSGLVFAPPMVEDTFMAE